ncbi:MAG: type II toxin-antitoxin system RelE/ParE family toxin [Acetatifactor sp.]|nr:type II toxin-antitoxin system RelE/ParE family toxin [Acetatifactor sp.]
MLHSFRKKTKKTPWREIARAKKERDDYLKRREI